MIMKDAGSALMGIGQGNGEGRAVQAARAAISSPLLEASIEGARGILLNITGGSDLTLFEVNEAAEIIHSVAHPDANIIFGTVIDEEAVDGVRVTVIAAGFDRWDEDRRGRSGGAGLAGALGSTGSPRPGSLVDEPPIADVFADSGAEGDDEGDDFDVPSFLR
jgi:cell division protein FtsZ